MHKVLKDLSREVVFYSNLLSEKTSHFQQVKGKCPNYSKWKSGESIPVVLGNMPSSGPQKLAWHLLS